MHVRITFQLTTTGGNGLNEFGISGSIKELGEWNTDLAVKLTRESTTLCTATVEIDSQNEEFEYKYIQFGLENEWEKGINRKRQVPSDILQITIGDEWNRNRSVLPLVSIDPYLQPFESILKRRHLDFQQTVTNLGGSLNDFSLGYKTFGLHRRHDCIEFREWAPNAKSIAIIGDFNQWQPETHPCLRDPYGVFTCRIPDVAPGQAAIPHLSRVKLRVEFPSGEKVDRISTWQTYTVQDTQSVQYHGVFWNPPHEYQWNHKRRSSPESLRIYECHVGMSSETGKVASYKEFSTGVLPRIKSLGYNAIQLMAIMEHVYYASFGYHVTNFFAPSSRYGTPDDFKELVDTAHGLKICVIMDVVHSHASSNVQDGINQFDGSDSHYFHAGARGYHTQWDSRLFDYSKYEVQRFLLSNLRYWIDEFRIDGFRFDGVTSMLYKHHGIGVGFSGNYDEYFGEDSDEESIRYLKLANALLHSLDPPVLTIAEDVSGMPGLCRSVDEGGIGFDYRLGMAIPDYWIKLIQDVPDEDWDIGGIVHQLLNRRFSEKTIAYAESHDQALVGDKTIAFRLMDKEMYENMSVLQPLTSPVDRGLALHKMIRLVTYALGGEGYLNFMGNEFGHPEWIDFPREGNDFSFHYCRRQWSLADDTNLRYRYLYAFDQAMHTLESTFHWLSRPDDSYVTVKHENDKLLVFDKAGLLWVFNFHPTRSFTEYRIGVRHPGKYQVVLSSDATEFGGHNRVDPNVSSFTEPIPSHNMPVSMQIYTPSRTVVVYRRS